MRRGHIHTYHCCKEAIYDKQDNSRVCQQGLVEAFLDAFFDSHVLLVDACFKEVLAGVDVAPTRHALEGHAP